jgi:mono/diheme cytochrome c family protein
MGFAAGAVALALVILVYAGFGLTDIRADVPAPAWATRWTYAAVHASIRRATPPLKSPLPPGDETLIAGGKLYLNDCVGCHGAPGKPPSEFGATFYPTAPQLARSGTRYSEAQVFWIAKHGIGRTGMGAQGPFYSDPALWSLAAFICRITDLPPKVAEALEEKTVK